MPRVHTVKRARKNYPNCGIKKGDTYYYWTFRYGGKRKSKTYPRQSQLTASDKLSRLYAAQEQIEDIKIDDSTEAEDIQAIAEEVAGEVREVGEEYQESCDNIRAQFTDSPTADECEEKAEAAEAYAGELESVDFDFEKPDKDKKETWEDDYTDYDEALEDWKGKLEQIVQELQGIDLSI